MGVLAWHPIDTVGRQLTVPSRVFARQMPILGGHWKQLWVVHLDGARTVLASGELRARGVVLTFDDVWADNYTDALGLPSRHRLTLPERYSLEASLKLTLTLWEQLCAHPAPYALRDEANCGRRRQRGTSG